MNYVVVDIGCYECGEESFAIGVYETEGEAQAGLEAYKARRPRVLGRSGEIVVLRVDPAGVAVYPES